jgi:hypothetical protein
MTSFLIFIHVLLCCFAIVLGLLTLHDLILKRVERPRLVWFLRCSLGSNLAVLLTQLHHLAPAQKVAMAAVYAAGVVIVGWRAFHLRGKWRATFAFATAFVVYLNALALSLQLPVLDATGLRHFQIALFVATVVFGVVLASRFSVEAQPAVVRNSVSHYTVVHR